MRPHAATELTAKQYQNTLAHFMFLKKSAVKRSRERGAQIATNNKLHVEGKSNIFNTALDTQVRLLPVVRGVSVS
jgi:hypothetical protein